MSIDVGRAFARGFDELTSVRGAVLLALFLVQGLGGMVVSNTLSARYLELIAGMLDVSLEEMTAASGGNPTPFALDVPLSTGLALSVVLWLTGAILMIVAIRAFASDASVPIPIDEVADDFPKTFVFYLLTSIVVAVIIAVSAVFFLIPALITGFLLYFWSYAVAIEDDNPIDALRDSYEVTTEHVGEALVLIVVLTIAMFVATSGVSYLPLEQRITTLGSTVLGQVVKVFTVATLADAYLQGTGRRGGPDEFEA